MGLPLPPGGSTICGRRPYVVCGRQPPTGRPYVVCGRRPLADALAAIVQILSPGVHLK